MPRLGLGLSLDRVQVGSNVNQPPVITNVVVSAYTDTTITVTATVDPGSTPLTPVLHYGLTTAYGSTKYATEGEISESGTVTFALTGLSVYTTYNFKVFAGEIASENATQRTKIVAEASATLHLDGTIIDVSGSKYFVDRIGGNNVLITGYDFPAGWVKGFPYKSAATIDIFGLTTVPVVSLFQNIDYGNQYFTRHVAQVVDANGVETTQPHVIDIVAYSAPLTGADLTAANTYFVVPAEITTAVRWVDAATGNNANAGTKAAPWATLYKAVTSATALDTIYVRSGAYAENNAGTASGYLYINKNLSFVGIGCAKLSSQPSASNIAFVVTGSNANFDRIVLADAVRKGGIVFQGTGVRPASILKNIRSNYNGASMVHQGGGTINILNVVSTDATSRVDVSGEVINFIDCIINNVVGIYDSSTLSNAVLNVKNSKVANSITVAGLHTTLNLIDTILTQVNPAAAHLDGDLKISFSTLSGTLSINTGVYGLLEVLNCIFTSSANAVIYSSKSTEFRVNNNVAISAGAGVYFKIAFDPGNGASTVEVKNNQIVHKNTIEPCVVIGNEAATNYNSITGIISGNRVRGNRDFNPTSVFSAHLMPVFNNSQIDVKYNFVSGGGLGIVYKNLDLDCSGKVVAYNIVKNCSNGITIKGPDSLLIHNNLVINCYAEMINCVSNVAATNNCAFKNNIIINTIAGSSVYAFNDQGSTNLDVDYNIYYSPDALKFSVSGIDKTFAQWQALGYDTHSIVLTTEQFNSLFEDFANEAFRLKLGSLAIGFGESLGDVYKAGLDGATVFGTTLKPVIVNKNQAALWDAGPIVS